MPLTALEFVTRWKPITLTERAAAQSHFIDLCEVLELPHPVAADQTGDNFTFEKRVSTASGGKGFADVWKRGFFAWEYKGKHKDLQAAYRQLLDYREDLENPPLLVVCDHDRFEVHTNFERTRPQVYRFSLDDLYSAAPTPNCAIPPLDVLRAVFTDPDSLRPEAAQARVTLHAAEEFAKLSRSLDERGIDSERAAHYLMRLLFCLFADSIGLLPDHLFRQMIELDRANPAKFTRKLRQLFAAMSNKGSSFGPHDIHYFNGGLFADDEVFDLTAADMSVLRSAAALDWSQVEPAIFGTLFERSLNPGKRSQQGAHYTSKEDILLIVEPVVIEPLRRRWEAVKAEATALAEAADKERLAEAAAKKKGTAYPKLRTQLQDTVFAWFEELTAVRILDPACGSGNFLYLALRRMLDLWHEARQFCAEHGLPTFLERQVHPSQLYGLEKNVYAQELASVVVWIGYLQWLHQNAIGWPTEPILRKLDNIQHRDAILAHDQNRDRLMNQNWWLHGRTRPALRRAINGLKRCIVTPEVAKHRVFAWMETDVVPDHKVHVIARDDDFVFGILQSHPHELWALRLCSSLGVTPSYNSQTTFETFPFPWPPGAEPKDSPRVEAIAAAARELVALRDAWLNPPDASEAQLKNRTLTKLYNEPPTWLTEAHRKLDEAVFVAYGWPVDLSDEDILSRLLSLNHARASVSSERGENAQA